MSEHAVEIALPLDERIQVALHEALGEDDSMHAYESIQPLLRILWDDGHYCGVFCEREDVKWCHHNPFPTRVLSPTEGRES